MAKNLLARLKAKYPEAVPPPGMTPSGLEAYILEKLREKLEDTPHGLEYLPDRGVYRAWVRKRQGFGRQAWTALARALLGEERIGRDEREGNPEANGLETPGAGGDAP